MYFNDSSSPVNKIFQNHKTHQLSQERAYLFSKATVSQTHQRYFSEEEDHRLPFKRDVDRIIHSKAYARYIDKTQVMYLMDNDHITHRGLHVQLVSNFSRSLADMLKLNVDLTEAISLGHDVGHPPFGHEGEGYLSIISKEFNKEKFDHARQSCKLFLEIEPLNLGLQVFDGFLCHDGGLVSQTLTPHPQKNWEIHFQECQQKLNEDFIQLIPMTLEGCLVKLCDTICYLGKDIEDAIRVGILKRQDLPKTALGSSNGEMLSRMSQDIIAQSFEQNSIGISEEMFEALKTLRKFNFEYIYSHKRLKTESEKIRRAYRLLFEILLEDYEKNDRNSHLWKDYLSTRTENYLKKYTPTQKIIDYIATMTDHYFINTLKKLILPKKIELI